MKRPTQDVLWKAIIEDLFDDFLKFFYSKYVRYIDLKKGFEFLDKELQSIYPKSNTKNRRADKLVKVWLKNGEEKWILIHIEVQGYKDDSFDFRVYSSHYRIRDRYGKPVSVLAIYTDEHKEFHPSEFSEHCLGTTISLKFNTFKLLDFPPEKLRRRKNVFAIVMEVAWYAMKRNKLKDEHLFDLSKKLIWKLARQGYQTGTIVKVLTFVKHYVRFEKSEFSSKFEEEIDIVLENNETMGILDLEKKIVSEKAREEGLEKGLELSVEIITLLQKGMSAKKIAKELNVDIGVIKKIKERLK